MAKNILIWAFLLGNFFVAFLNLEHCCSVNQLSEPTILSSLTGLALLFIFFIMALTEKNKEEKFQFAITEKYIILNDRSGKLKRQYSRGDKTNDSLLVKQLLQVNLETRYLVNKLMSFYRFHQVFTENKYNAERIAENVPQTESRKNSTEKKENSSSKLNDCYIENKSAMRLIITKYTEDYPREKFDL